MSKRRGRGKVKRQRPREEAESKRKGTGRNVGGQADEEGSSKERNGVAKGREE